MIDAKKTYQIVLIVKDDAMPYPFTKKEIKERLESAINEAGVTVIVKSITETYSLHKPKRKEKK